MAGQRTVAILGPIPRDHITTHQGDTFDKYGCVLYTAAALSALMEPTDRICPVVHVRKQDEAPIKEQLAQFANVDLTGIRSDNDRGDIVELTYTTHNHRDERQTGFMSPILPGDLDFVLDADAFVCVPITDYEVGQSTLEYIKTHTSAMVLLDAHGPTNTLVRGGERHHRLWVERDAWLPHVDILKMNLEEAGCSWFPDRSEAGATGKPMTPQEMPSFAAHCLGSGVKAVCITLDEEGCVVYHLDETGALVEETIGRINVENVVDTTGCGDSFAAGMAFGYLEHGDYVTACRYGNAMGAQRCSGSDLRVYRSLAETQVQITENYGGVLVGHA
ncbi:carbohydrate kinase family protein [Mycolicibacterium sp. CR10]|uniref:carbohydrate kinase family protein n=1 Tax=Mycolicibacterium sp. CR10 TaxID=2562314 RepID=UPI0010C14B3E|nr:carbohydrate kinase family protein [Mycolicibacterium sp. CR10]